MPEKAHDALTVLIAILVAVFGLIYLVNGLEASSSALGKLWFVLAALFLLATALGFARKRGWAFVTVSVLLLVSWMVEFILMVTGFDRGGWDGGRPHLLALLGIIALIGYLGRWKIERRFRPHLDTGDEEEEHAHAH